MKTYTASRLYHCECCDGEIRPGEGFTIERGGNFYKIGHEPKDRTEAAREDTKEIITA